MKTERDSIHLEDDDLRELFSLFASCTKEEKRRVYDSNNRHYFRNEDLDSPYEVTMEKREFALDAWRAVIAFLHAKSFRLSNESQLIDLSFVEQEFI